MHQESQFITISPQKLHRCATKCEQINYTSI